MPIKVGPDRTRKWKGRTKYPDGSAIPRHLQRRPGDRENTSRENRLEELGRVDAEKAYTSKGRRDLKDEKKRIVREVREFRAKGGLIKGKPKLATRGWK